MESETAAMEAQADQPASEAEAANPVAEVPPSVVEAEPAPEAGQVALQAPSAAESTQAVAPPVEEAQSEDVVGLSADQAQSEELPETSESTTLTDQAATPTEGPEPAPAPLLDEVEAGDLAVGGDGPAIAPTEAETEAEPFNPFLKVALIITGIFLVGAIILGIFSWSSPRRR
jgi:hypothetical protein